MSKCECKECLHYDVCSILMAKAKHQTIEFVKDRLNQGNVCDHYKSKSLFVELPCRCKDCKHSKQPYIEYDDVFECYADAHYTGTRLVEADDFCKYAELKEMGCGDE